MGDVVHMLAFAGARDVIGQGEFDFPLTETCTAEQLKAAVCAHYPSLQPYQGSLRLAVNGVYAQGRDLVNAGDEVALIPPVAGG